MDLQPRAIRYIYEFDISIMDNIGELSKNSTPRTVYNTFSSNNNGNSINNLKQVGTIT